MSILIQIALLALLAAGQVNYAAEGPQRRGGTPRNEITPMRFTRYEPCAEREVRCRPRILARGAIERDSAKKLSAFLASARVQDPSGMASPFVCLDSPGGDVGG